ncbi:MAG: hypothetical protein QXU93_07985 [Thermoproteus sp.]
MPRVVIGQPQREEPKEEVQPLVETVVEPPSQEVGTKKLTLSLPSEVVNVLEKSMVLMKELAADEQDRQMILQMTVKKLKSIKVEISDEDREILTILATVLGLCPQR